jgi:hypothetical protein
VVAEGRRERVLHVAIADHQRVAVTPREVAHRGAHAEQQAHAARELPLLRDAVGSRRDVATRAAGVDAAGDLLADARDHVLLARMVAAAAPQPRRGDAFRILLELLQHAQELRELVALDQPDLAEHHEVRLVEAVHRFEDRPDAAVGDRIRDRGELGPLRFLQAPADHEKWSRLVAHALSF